MDRISVRRWSTLIHSNHLAPFHQTPHRDHRRTQHWHPILIHYLHHWCELNFHGCACVLSSSKVLSSGSSGAALLSGLMASSGALPPVCLVLFTLGIVSRDKMKQKLLRDKKALLHHRTRYDETRAIHYRLNGIRHDCLSCNDKIPSTKQGWRNKTRARLIECGTVGTRRQVLLQVPWYEQRGML